MMKIVIFTQQPQNLSPLVMEFLVIMEMVSTQKEFVLNVFVDVTEVFITKLVASLDYFSILLLKNVTGPTILMDVHKNVFYTFRILLLCKPHKNTFFHTLEYYH